MKSASFIITFIVSFSFFPCSMPEQPGSGGISAAQRAAYGEENWKKEFEELCGNTDDSMKLSTDELKKSIAGCDRLMPSIEALEETTRKVYLKRLRMCRSLMVFVLEAKEKK